jgi:hypothetical protein
VYVIFLTCGQQLLEEVAVFGSVRPPT